MVIIPPPLPEETEALAAIDFERQGFHTLRDWIELNPNSPGLQASARRLQVHQDRIVQLQIQIDNLRAARREAGWVRARGMDRGGQDQQPLQPLFQEADLQDRRLQVGPLIEEVDLNGLGPSGFSVRTIFTVDRAGSPWF